MVTPIELLKIHVHFIFCEKFFFFKAYPNLYPSVFQFTTWIMASSWVGWTLYRLITWLFAVSLIRKNPLSRTSGNPSKSLASPPYWNRIESTSNLSLSVIFWRTWKLWLLKGSIMTWRFPREFLSSVCSKSWTKWYRLSTRMETPAFCSLLKDSLLLKALKIKLSIIQ